VSNIETCLDPRELRNVLGAFVTGVTVVTTLDEHGQPQGVTANSFSSVSLDPPLVLWSQSHNARSFPAFRDSGRFLVNILAWDQVAVSQRFARAGEDKFAGVAISESKNGLPIINGCTAYLECEKVATYPGGDHAVFLGRIERFEQSGRRPLAFGGGAYMVTRAHEIDIGDGESQVVSPGHSRALRLVHGEFFDICSRLDATLGLAVWGNHGPTVVRWEYSRRPVVDDLPVGMVVSPLRSACGKAFSAFLPREATNALIEADTRARLSQGSIPAEDESALEDELAAVRRCGLAQAVSPRFGDPIGSIAAPIFDSTGEMIMSLIAVETAERLDNAETGIRLRRMLIEEAREISRRLGHGRN
jgi:flavin reductase (DIM6/NTAB) family NADH-FMN oxidoreductase RutF/DNA-binding IclR family transcriptional regulator